MFHNPYVLYTEILYLGIFSLYNISQSMHFMENNNKSFVHFKVISTFIKLMHCKVLKFMITNGCTHATVTLDF